MSVVSPLVLLVLGALTHGSTALQCYICDSEYGQYCDDPLDTTKVHKFDCATDSCHKQRGTQQSENNSIVPVVILLALCCVMRLGLLLHEFTQFYHLMRCKSQD